MNSKQLNVGNSTEELIAELFKKYRFWSYICPKRIGGQPVDIICLKENINWLIDAKHVRKEEVSFDYSRIEPNQITSLSYAYQWANIENSGFAVYFERDMSIRYLSYKKWLETSKNGKKSINMNELPLLEEIINEKDRKND